jgi:hypothetical protein
VFAAPLTIVDLDGGDASPVRVVVGLPSVPIQHRYAEQNFMLKSPKWLIPALVVVAVVSSVVLYLLFKRDPHAPPAIVVSACGDVPASVRRMTAGYGTQIDAPEDAFVVKSTLQDMPPGRPFRHIAQFDREYSDIA